MLSRAWWQFMLGRQKVLNAILSHLYGSKMQVMPAGHVGLAGAMVLWTVQDGGRQMVFVRSPNGRDTRARLVSCMGMGRSADMAQAMREAVRNQLGPAFAKSLKLDKLSLDRVAAAPMFTYTDEDNGIVTPVQVLMWVQQIQPVQLELLELPEGQELVLVSESLMRSGKAMAVAPTHYALWRSVLRHLPVKTLPREEDADAREERLAAEDIPATRKMLH